MRDSNLVKNRSQDGYCAILASSIPEKAWYSIAEGIADGENRVRILVRSAGQKNFQSMMASLQNRLGHWVKLFSRILSPSRVPLGLAIVVMVGLSLTIVPQAGASSDASSGVPSPPVEPSLGSRIFTANCAACHIGGNNVILAEKNLSKDALAKYAMDSIVAIKTQVTNGKNAMPAFGDNLTSAEIEAVARYVLTQSQQDWKGSSVGLQ